VDQVNLPQGFPLLGGLDEAPAISTGLRKIASAQPGADAQDVFPKELCNESTGTMCQAVLPGCMAVPANSKFFPSLVVNHNRPFHYNQSSKSKFYILMKEALAYAFSTLPEAVDILIKEVNETRTKGEHDEKHPSILSGSNRSWPATFKHWWGERRLHEEADVEEGGRVEMHFREGLPFRLTHPLVAAMLKNYHTEVEDDATESLGPLRITSFFLDENISHDSRIFVLALATALVKNCADFLQAVRLSFLPWRVQPCWLWRRSPWRGITNHGRRGRTTIGHTRVPTPTRVAWSSSQLRELPLLAAGC
jgi:hypothetical protein